MLGPATIPTECPNTELRHLTIDDAEMLFEAAMASGGKWLRSFSPKFVDELQSIETAKSYVDKITHDERLSYGIWRDANFLGSIILRPVDDRRSRVGYWLDTRHAGNGYATFALQAMTNYALNQADYESVHARIAETNRRSAAVAERAGFMQTHHSDGRHVFVRARENYKSRVFGRHRGVSLIRVS